MKKFNIPEYYKSSIISRLKEYRRVKDPRKKNFSPSVLDFGPVRIYLARHFGFCYGVENAIEISYKALAENPGKQIYLLSQMIHNPNVNRDLQDKGIRFIMDTEGNKFMEWEELKPSDIVIIPAFGTTIETEQKLKDIGIEVHKYDTTCPFVERVWNRTEQLGDESYSVIIHGKHNHEETRATFSHSRRNAPSIIVKNMAETKYLTDYIAGSMEKEEFMKLFEGKFTEGFDPDTHLDKVGVVNQTTMLATETNEIANFVKEAILKKFGKDNLKQHFADTRDTLCYATNDNQQATYSLLNSRADFAIVVGGYNSSNTSHIVELCEEKLPTYYISTANEILAKNIIRHYDHHNNNMKTSRDFLPHKDKVDVILTSGASCPDATVEDVLQTLLSFYNDVKSVEEVLAELK
jgi:4-hydroxy-3-methylbut-2-enyl diphosphate reductase